MNDDLISRSALRKDIERLYSVYKDNKDYFYTDVLDHIDNAPTVEQFDDTELQRAVGYSDGYLTGKEERPQEEKEHKERIFNPFDHRTIGEI